MTGIASSEAFYARLLDDHLVLVDHNRSELGVLNPSASLLWLLLDESVHDQNSLSKACAELLSDTPENLSETIRDTLNEWRENDWLDEVAGGYRITRKVNGALKAKAERGVWHPADQALPVHEDIAELCFRLGSANIKLILGDTGRTGFPYTLGRVRGLLSGMTPIDRNAATLVLRWVHDGEAFWLATAESVLCTGEESFAISSLISALFMNAYAKEGLFATMHAAAVSQAGSVFLMPGVSGAGKSTLTAYLVAHGWGYLGDDIVALGRAPQANDFEIHRFPTAIGLKQGSWPVLREHYPDMDRLPVIPYADRQSRFLPIRENRAQLDMPQRLRAILLPTYTPGGRLEIDPISPVQALCELTRAGVATRQTVHEQHAEILLDMLENIPAYRLTYGELNEAASGLESLMACP